MALKFLDGCVHYDTSQINRKWTGKQETQGTVTISAGSGRNGVGSLRYHANAAVGVIVYAYKTFTARAGWVIGFALKLSAIQNAGSNQIVALVDAGTLQCELRFDNAGHLIVSRNGTTLTGGTSTFTLTAGTWYYIEWAVTIANSIAANSCQVYVDGVSRVNVTTGQDTQNTANAFADTIRVGPVPSATPNVAYDMDTCDYYILDDQSGQTTVYGDTKVVTLMPTGTGTTNQWTPDTGTQANNYSRVNATVSADGASGYVQSGTINQFDSYAMANLAGGTASVRSCQVVLTAIETDVGTRTIGSLIVSGGVSGAGAGQQLTGGYAMYLYEYEKDPNGSIAWTPTSLNAAEVGQVLLS